MYVRIGECRKRVAAHIITERPVSSFCLLTIRRYHLPLPARCFLFLPYSLFLGNIKTKKQQEEEKEARQTLSVTQAYNTTACQRQLASSLIVVMEFRGLWN